MITIKTFDSQIDRSQIESVFFETSTKKAFSSLRERENFQYKYLDFYFDHYPEMCLLLLENDLVCGYIIGALDSRDQGFLKQHSYYKDFLGFLNDYPAHLHINIVQSLQGQGWGRKLLLQFEEKLKEKGIGGLHIFTDTMAVNVQFYQSCGFDFQKSHSSKSASLMFMGKSLISDS